MREVPSSRVDALTQGVVGRGRGAASMPQALTKRHGAVLGYGVLTNALNERLSRVERHLGLPPGCPTAARSPARR